MTQTSTQLRRRRLLAALPLLVTGLYVRGALADASVRQASRSLMGTRLDMTVQADSGVDTDLAMSAAFAEMQRLVDLMSRYRIGNPVHALHLASGLQPIAVPSELLDVLQMAQAMSQRSEGAFDITVGALTAWDFTQATPIVPDATEVEHERQLVNYRDLVINPSESTAFLRKRGMRIDLGGIAKLPILQAGMRTLHQHGIRNAMLNGGGDVVVKGQLQGRDWRIGLRDPRAPERILGTVELNDGYVAASGDYERFFIRNGHRYHHVLDPKTGQPSTGPHGVALISRTPDGINGMGAVIMVAGAKVGRSLIAPMKQVDALIVDRGEGLWLSPGMASRLHG
jgi:thiamine biosynthesis lipoprotein